ncbi:hypothetical protein ACVRY5_09250 [Streptococcus ilei]|uniref:hypothetical protein n=1 Tax=Streptococcus ilei TaxID=1156431 RepID=UPI0003B92AF7|nr:hypothetical protein [Streptococcus ilei]AGY40873.1 hypothetical protein N596_09050 [Streptococcus ilei]
MEYSKLGWEEVSKFEEIKGYGQHIWRHHEKYFFVADEGGIVEQRVVYELPYRTISITLPSFSELLEKSNLI